MAGNKKEYSLGFTIGAQLKASFASTFKNVEKQLKSAQTAVKNCKDAWATFGGNAVKLVTGLSTAAAGAAAAVWKVTDSVGENAVAVGRNAARLNMSVEEFQKLRYAFKTAGVGGDEFLDVMTKLDDKLVTIASDGKATRNWGKEFGLDAQKLVALSPEDRIKALADHLNGLEDPVERGRLALELFGEKGAEMGRVLEMGSAGINEAGRQFVETGNMISEETTKQADKYAELKGALTEAVDGIKLQLTTGLLPVFTDVFARISTWIQGVDWADWGEKVAGWVTETLPKVYEIATSIGDFISKIANGIVAVKDFVGGWKNLAKIIGGMMAAKTAISGIIAVVKTVTAMFNPWVLAITVVIAIIALLVANWDKVKEIVRNVAAAVYGFIAQMGEAIAGVIEGIIVWWNNLKTRVIEIATAISDWWNEKIAAIQEFFVGLWEAVTEGVSAFVESVTGFFTGLWEGIVSIIEPIVGFFSGIWDKVKSTVKGFVEKVLGIFQPIADFFSSIGDWIGKIFGGKKTMTVDVQTIGDAAVADIPGHAAGGIFTRPHFAQIAEGGDAEAVVPINNRPASRGIWEAAGRMAGFSRGTGGTPTSVSIPVNVNITGNADAETVRGLRGAAASISADVEAAVRRALAADARQKARLAY